MLIPEAGGTSYKFFWCIAHHLFSSFSMLSSSSSWCWSTWLLQYETSVSMSLRLKVAEVAELHDNHNNFIHLILALCGNMPESDFHLGTFRVKAENLIIAQNRLPIVQLEVTTTLVICRSNTFRIYFLSVIVCNCSITLVNLQKRKLPRIRYRIIRIQFLPILQTHTLLRWGKAGSRSSFGKVTDMQKMLLI